VQLDRVLFTDRGRTLLQEVHVLRAVLVCLITGCAASSSGIDSASITCPPDSTLSYENFGRVLIAEQCLSCHTNKERPPLTTQAAIQSYRQAVMENAVTTTSMPKGASMPLEERELLGEWLACGAP
jgi:uncharacterized membrane protein